MCAVGAGSMRRAPLDMRPRLAPALVKHSSELLQSAKIADLPTIHLQFTRTHDLDFVMSPRFMSPRVTNCWVRQVSVSARHRVPEIENFRGRLVVFGRQNCPSGTMVSPRRRKRAYASGISSGKTVFFCVHVRWGSPGAGRARSWPGGVLCTELCECRPTEGDGVRRRGRCFGEMRCLSAMSWRIGPEKHVLLVVEGFGPPPGSKTPEYLHSTTLVLRGRASSRGLVNFGPSLLDRQSARACASLHRTIFCGIFLWSYA